MSCFSSSDFNGRELKEKTKISQRIFLEGPHVFDYQRIEEIYHIFADGWFPLATTILSLMGSVRHFAFFSALDMANTITMDYFSSFHLEGRGFSTTIYTPVSLISYV